MKYYCSAMIPHSFVVECDEENFEQELDKAIESDINMAEYGGDGIHVECEDGRSWDE